MVKHLIALPKRALILLVRGYQLILSPHLASSCNFTPTCSGYAIQALEKYGALKGSVLAAHRIMRCHPWGGHGYDPPVWYSERKDSMSTVPDAHRQAAGSAGLTCAIITCSDTRSEVDDRSGPIMKSLLELAGHEIVSYEVVREDPALIRSALERAAAKARIVLLNGGTGVSPRDNTVDVVRAFVERDLPGFGELFRTLSYQEIGAAAMLSRAVAGTRGATAVFATPGSSAAVTLAMEKLILPEIRHLASLLDG